jgi:hypothetical protein
MSKIVNNRTLPATTVQNPPDSTRKVEVSALDLRGIRGTLGTSTLLDESTERLWRNCKYPETVHFRCTTTCICAITLQRVLLKRFPNTLGM